MKTGQRYYNCSRAEQIVELLEVDALNVVYKVTQGNYKNPLKIFPLVMILPFQFLPSVLVGRAFSCGRFTAT